MKSTKQHLIPWLWVVSLMLAVISFAFWYIIGPQDFTRMTGSNPSLLEARSLREGKIVLPSRVRDTALYDGRVLNVFQPGQTLYFLVHDLIAGEEAVKWVQIEIFIVFVLSVFLLSLAVLSLSGGRIIFPVALVVSAMFGVPYIVSLRPALMGAVWRINHCFAILFMAAALVLIAMKKNTARALLLIGLCIAGATLFRGQSILLLFLPIAMLFQDSEGQSWQIRQNFSSRQDIKTLGRKILCLLAFPILAVLVIAGFQIARFHSPFENGYAYIYEGQTGFLAERATEHGLMSLYYLPENLYRTFCASPRIEFEGWRIAELEGDPRGNSLLFSQPILLILLLLWPSAKAARVQAFLVASLLLALPVWLYHNPGYYAPGYARLSLDYLPLWIATLAVAARYCPTVKRVLLFSIPLAAFAVWYGYKLMCTTSW